MGFTQNLQAVAKEDITAEEKKTYLNSWVKDAVDEFFAAVAQNDSVMHANLICAQGHADYNDIMDSLPSNRVNSILAAGSLYIRNETNVGSCNDPQWRNKVDCEAEGTCTDTQYNNDEAACTGASETWTSANNTWDISGKYYIIRGGVIYTFGTKIEQLNLAMHQIVKRTAIKALEHHQSLSPTGKRGDQIVKLTTESDGDTGIFSADANATYVAGDLNDPINLNTQYQPRANTLGV